MPNIQNPGKHEHRLTKVQGQAVCQDCQQVIITPILSQEDFEERTGMAITAMGGNAAATDLAINGQPAMMWIDALKSVCAKKPMRLDFMLIELCERLGYEWPDYISKLADMTKGENPPHLNDATLGEVE